MAERIRTFGEFHTIGLDCWTSNASDQFLGLSVHYTNKVTAEMESWSIACKPLTGEHTAENLARWTTETLAPWSSHFIPYGFTSSLRRLNPWAYVADNASTLDAAFLLVSIDLIQLSGLILFISNWKFKSSHFSGTRAGVTRSTLSSRTCWIRLMLSSKRCRLGRGKLRSSTSRA